MTDFFFPTRFDYTVAEEGVWFKVEDENDNLWGRFKCILLDNTLPHYKVALQRLQRKANSGANHNKKVDETFAAELLIEMSLRDWDIKDAKGKAVPFTKETALDYFTRPQGAFVLSKLSPLISDVSYFQSAEQNEAGDALGNS